MTGTMIDEYLEIEKRYLEIQGKNDIASFDFARGFLSQLHGLERAIRRLSGEDGYERLRERRVEMLAQLSAEDHRKLSSLDVFRRKVFDRSFKLRVAANSEIRLRIKQMTAEALSLEGEKRQRKLVRTFRSLRRFLLNVKPLRQSAIEEITTRMSDSDIEAMSQDPGGEAGSRVLSFMVQKLSAWGSTNLAQEVRELMSRDQLYVILPDLLGLLTHHLEKLSIQFQNFELDLVDVDLLSELEDEQFSEKFRNFELSLSKTNGYVAKLIRSSFRKVPQMLK